MLHGDTAISHATGSTPTGAAASPSAVSRSGYAGEKVIEKARQIVAHQLEVVGRRPRATRTARSRVKGSPDKEMTIKAAAWAAFAAHNLPDGMEPGLEATATYDPPNFSWPAGAHAAVVEVDTETGDARLVRYVAVDDVGTVVNPMIVDGQVHGGDHAGHRGGALRGGRVRRGRQPARRRRSPRTSCRRRPSCRRSSSTAPRAEAPTNPLGAKGVGETGTIAAAPAVINAVVDALSHLGVTDIQMPATPGAGLARDRGGEAVIPAAFDYEVAESVEHAIELLGARRRREAARRRALARAGDEAAHRAAVEARRHRPALRPRLRARRGRRTSRSAR